LQLDKLLQDDVSIGRLPIRGETHEFVLTAVDLEPAVVGKRGVQEAERMREPHFLIEFDRVAPTNAIGGCAPLSDAVEREDAGLFKRAWEERARGVTLVMIEEEETCA